MPMMLGHNKMRIKDDPAGLRGGGIVVVRGRAPAGFHGFRSIFIVRSRFSKSTNAFAAAGVNNK